MLSELNYFFTTFIFTRGFVRYLSKTIATVIKQNSIREEKNLRQRISWHFVRKVDICIFDIPTVGTRENFRKNAKRPFKEYVKYLICELLLVRWSRDRALSYRGIILGSTT